MTGPFVGTRVLPAVLEFHTIRARNFPTQRAHRGPEVAGAMLVLGDCVRGLVMV